ncbi:FkbM family methyltransferase [Bradyrhizobiaceae bacterium SG-6C]|nr:FkbM family methyltransferase [Bradyrhizobiaceae bacterium SG-6C]
MPEPMISYAQNAEDVILNRVFAGQRTGFYIDVGAWDPDIDSVTKHFYLSGWRGINIEPTDLYHARLIERRPADINLKVAIGPHPGRARFVQHGDSGLSGLAETTERLTSFNAISDFNTRQIEVEVTPLSEITSRYAPPDVDFLKIDVEGGERGVIESAEWRAFRPRVVIVESVKPITNQPAWFDWEGLLLDAGYCFALFDGLNRYYYRAEEPTLRPLLSVPANILDSYVTAAFKRLQERCHELESKIGRG